nr:competence type IV pilus minor pilin ComGD [Pontibacillus yanchengensis]
MSITIPLSTSIYREYKEDLFLKQLKTDILSIQQDTMTEGETYSVFLKKDHYEIYNHRLIREVPYPKGWWIETFTSTNKIYFDVNGRIRSPGTFYIRTPTKSYKMVFPFGKGRFYVTER